MTETTEIRRRPDGSIDTAFYVRRGRALHGAAVCEAAGKAGALWQLTRLAEGLRRAAGRLVAGGHTIAPAGR